MYIYVLYKAVFSPWSFTGFLPWPFKRTWEALNNLLTKKILHCWHNIYPGGFVYVYGKSKMAASSHGSRRMTIEEALDKIFTDRDSEFSDEESEDGSDYNGDSSGSEENDESDEEVESFKEHESPSTASAGEDSESEEEDAAPNRGQGRGRGGRRGGKGDRGGGRGGRNAARGGCGRERGAHCAQQPHGEQVVQQAALETQWISVDREPNIPPFTDTPGIKVPLPNNPSTGDFLNLFLTDEFFDILVEQTNSYATQYKRNNPNLPPHSRANEWFDTTRAEMKQFVALSLLIGIVREPEIAHYWSTNPLLKGSIFNSVMPQNRFQSILQFLHFADNRQFDPNDPDRDRLYKVRPVVEYLVNKSRTVYVPEDHISIDRELLLWKGHLAFKQYIPTKRA